ncbi:MAG: hypothetical protein WA997_04505 [Anaerolineales bacterium]|nr:hypothetical protein [Anaerolineales bacterium]
MLDDFRDEANASPYFEDESSEYFEEISTARRRGKLLGMTAGQRLVVAIMLFVMTCIVGSLALLVLEVVVPPAFF